MLLSPPPRPDDLPPEPERDPRPSPGTGATIWLVRHGRVTAPDVAYGDDDVPLSDEGVRQTDAIARGLAGHTLAAVASSPLVRARRMGEAIATATGAPLQVVPELSELHRGAWQGLSREEYARRWLAAATDYWRDPLGWRGHEGESEADVVERAWPTLVDVARRADGGVAVVTAHRQVIRALTAAAVGVPAGRSHSMALDPAHAVLLRDASNGWILERTNVARPGSPHAAEPEGGPPEDVVTQLA